MRISGDDIEVLRQVLARGYGLFWKNGTHLERIVAVADDPGPIFYLECGSHLPVSVTTRDDFVFTAGPPRPLSWGSLDPVLYSGGPMAPAQSKQKK